MADQKLDGTIAGSWVLTGSAFALGLMSGLILKDVVRQLRDRVRHNQTRREYERTVTYDENLPDSLGRREPAPYPDQPRYGGTGAIGVSPALVDATRRRS
jgi:hypothetical protein